MSELSTRVRRRSCRHVWRVAARGRHEVCAECGDRFPCRGTCTHIDCAMERTPPPAGARRFALLVGEGYVFGELAS